MDSKDCCLGPRVLESLHTKQHTENNCCDLYFVFPQVCFPKGQDSLLFSTTTEFTIGYMTIYFPSICFYFLHINKNKKALS